MRLFVAIPLPDEISAALSLVAEKLPAAFRRSPAEQMHITLSFLGEVSEDRLTCVISGLESITHSSFRVELGGLGSFPGVVFAKVEDQPALNALAENVMQRMRGCGVPQESRPYRPHVTLARSRDRRARVTAQPFSPLSFDATEFALYRSFLGPKGPRYERLRHFPLAP